MCELLSKSAPTNRCSKNICVHAVVIAELELRDVQREIFAADLMERAHDAAFEDAPEVFNRLRVDRASD